MLFGGINMRKVIVQFGNFRKVAAYPGDIKIFSDVIHVFYRNEKGKLLKKSSRLEHVMRIYWENENPKRHNVKMIWSRD
jgi:hypothetical protein